MVEGLLRANANGYSTFTAMLNLATTPVSVNKKINIWGNI
jgi:hypothetical protein